MLDPDVGYSLAEKDGASLDVMGGFHFRDDWSLMTMRNGKEHKHENRHCTTH